MNWFRPYSFAFLLVLFSAAQLPSTVSGEVTAYLTNRIGDYDGLRLHTAKGDIVLHFPPHQAAMVRKMAPLRQVVEVSLGERPPRPGGAGLPADYQLVSLKTKATGVVVRLADLPTPAPQPGRLITTEGALTGIQTDETGRTTALLIGPYLVELKPHQQESVGALLTPGKRISVVGYERTATGFVNQTGRKLIHPTTLTIGDQTFSL